MNAHRLRAPSEDGSVLAAPPLAEAPALLVANAARLAGWDHDFQGRPASWLRPIVRADVLDKARGFLAGAGLDVTAKTANDHLVVTGHQPEMFHPGVWIKNFAASRLAHQAGGAVLNLIVDNDIPKSSTIRVPHEVGGDLRVERVAFDAGAGETPYEDLEIADESLFASFGQRVRDCLPATIADPVLDVFWPRAMAMRGVTRKRGLRLALARRALESAWGVQNLEIPLSIVCETEGFLWFASHLLAHLPRFQEVHNDALKRYRTVYGIRSRNHPVPALSAQGEWREAPFWAWRAGEPRRRAVFARQRARTIDLRIGGDDQPFLEIPLGPDREACCAVERLRTLPGLGVRLRTRALTTTMFARYLLGDLFLHGIGGAKYDELGDEIAGRFFGFPPPAYMTLSMTLRLGLDVEPDAPGRLAELNRALRDLTYQPDRHLSGELSAEEARWVESKHRAVMGPVETHAQRKERFREIRRCNQALQGRVADQRAALIAEHARAIAQVRRDVVARNREYALVLYSQSRLRQALGRSLPELPRPGF